VGATVFYESSSELATLTNTFAVAGVATDPTAVTLDVTSPSGTTTTYNWPTPATITRTSAGVFTKDIACIEDGEWQAVWTGTTAASDVQVVTWRVFETGLGNLYVTPTALKSKLEVTSTRDDFEINAACFAASRAIELACERLFYRSASGTVRLFAPRGLYETTFGPYNDLVSVTTLKTSSAGTGTFDVTWTAADYELSPLNTGAAPETRPYTRLKAIGGKTFPIPTGYGSDYRVQVTGVFGWPSVPSGIRQAALILAMDIHKSSPFGVVGFGEFGALRVRQNPMVAMMIDPYIHPAAKLKAA
jgi:hypothetical protein